MRVYIQKQLLELLQSIWDGVKYAKSKNNKENAESVLMDCYSAVNSIEAAMQSGFTTERFSEYSDALNILKAMLEYLNDAIAMDESVSEVADDIKKQIKLIKNELTNENEVKLEIVFMPYNANMWDSLESIWIAARDDEKCDAYVVPIPYYNRNPDHSFGEFKYEGNDFPDYVPIVHYNNYDLEKRKPDVIYIHNPYDEFNYVTSVDPKYYSYELKKYTDMLVYVPYFVCADKIVSSLCTTSAVNNANIIIVQSKAAEKSYKKYCVNEVISLGTPKSDKVINTIKEELTFPVEWKTLINNKKVVLFNTHLGSLMSNSESFLMHLKNVLSEFKNRDDIVLWWRPHPLSLETIKSMNPRVLRQYNQIVDEYKRSGYGIYDDTKDLERALVISDAYYGDYSSIVLLFRALGKPVMLQNNGLIKQNLNKNELKTSALDFIIKDNIMWFIPNNICGIFSMDMVTHIVKFHGAIPETRMFDYNMYSSMQIIDNTIYLIPSNAKNIITFDIKTYTYKYVTNNIKSTTREKFFNSYLHKDIIYMLPCFSSIVIKYNPRNQKLNEISNICNELDKYDNTGYCYFHKNAIVNKGILLIPTYTSNTIIEYNLKTDNVTLHSVGYEKNCYSCIAFDGSYYWLFSCKGNIIKWNKANGSIKEISEFSKQFMQGIYFNFIDTVVYDNFIFAFPFQSNMILRINTLSDEIEIVSDLNERLNVHNTYRNTLPYWSKYTSVKVIGDYIYAWSQFEECLQKINPETCEIENIDLHLSGEDYTAIMSKPLLNAWDNSEVYPFMCSENSLINLEFLLDRLSVETTNIDKINLDNIKASFENMDGTCGAKVYEYVKSKINK